MHDFKLPDNLFGYDDRNELSEGVIETSQMAMSMMDADPDVLASKFTKVFGFSNVVRTIFLIIKLLKAPGNDGGPPNMLNKIQRYLFIAGLVFIIITWGFVGAKGLVLPLIQTLISIFSRSMGKITTLILKFIVSLLQKFNKTIIGTFIALFMAPVGGFFIATGSLLLKGDVNAQRLIRNHDKRYIKMYFSIFKLIGTSLMNAVPFLRPILQFIGGAFKKIATLFRSGGAKAKQAVSRAQQESTQPEALTEGLAMGLALAPIASFFFKIIKSTKILGIFGLVIILMIKFIPSLKNLLQRIPIIGSIVTLMQTTGKNLANKFKLNSAAKQLNQVQEEAKELKTTVEITNSVHV